MIDGPQKSDRATPDPTQGMTVGPEIRPRLAKEILRQTQERHRQAVEDLQIVLDMLPSELTRAQDRALCSLLR